MSHNLSTPGAPGASNGRSSAPTTRTVIHVEGANKIYGSGGKARHVLRDLSMGVKEHTIYGLLGASGCGKTTLLTCIVGLRQLDSGSILICGHRTGSSASGVPGRRVGYMPQEIALNGEFTIIEVLAYFGRIYGMSATEVKNRTKYLVNLLSLSGFDQQIQNLSDGQKRRVSLAVTLIHQPELLILDEPTVGCDPLLRESIWSYLHDLVAQKSATVIVTTHYIEEMRQADRIGIMRSGRLLCEDSPGNLLQMYNENLLDAVVVKLCKTDGGSGEANRTPADVAPLPCLRSSSAGSELVREEWRLHQASASKGTATTSVFDRMRGLLVKDLTVVVRNWLFSLLLALLPGLTVGFLCFTIGGALTELPVGVVNYEAIDGQCPKPPAGLNCSSMAPPGLLSCAFENALDQNMIKLIRFETEDHAEEQALKGKIWGYFWFGANFSRQFHERMVVGSSSNETLLESMVNIRLDDTGFETTRLLQAEFVRAFQKLSSALLSACDVPGGALTALESPVHFGSEIFPTGDKQEGDLKGFMGTGATVGFLFFMCALQCGLTYIIEKKDGMLARTLVTGVGRLEIMGSHFVVQLLVVAQAQILVCFLLVFVIFDAQLAGSLLLGYALVLLNCVAGLSLGFLLATFCSDEKFAMLLAMGLVFPNFLVAGILWPKECLPAALQWVSNALPCTAPVAGFRAIASRGFGGGDEIVWLGFAVLGGWAALYWTIVALWTKFGQRKQ